MLIFLSLSFGYLVGKFTDTIFYGRMSSCMYRMGRYVCKCNLSMDLRYVAVFQLCRHCLGRFDPSGPHTRFSVSFEFRKRAFALP